MTADEKTLERAKKVPKSKAVSRPGLFTVPLDSDDENDDVEILDSGIKTTSPSGKNNTFASYCHRYCLKLLLHQILPLRLSKRQKEAYCWPYDCKPFSKMM